MFQAAQTPPRISTLILLTGISVLSLNMFLPSLPNIAAEFGVSFGMANLSIAGFLGVTAVLQIIMGPLSDRYGRRPVLLAGLAVFAIASVGCLLARDIWVFLFFRVLQGAIVGGMALSRAVVRDMFDERTAASQLGYISMVMAIAPMTGPMIGGLLDQTFGWRASFVFFVLAGFGLLVLAWRDLGETNTSPTKTILSQFKAYPELLRSRRFWGYSICITFSLGAFYIYITGAALVGAAVFELSPAATGLAVGAITMGFAFGSFLSGRMSKRYPVFVMTLAGRIVGAAGLLLGLTLVLSGIVTPISFFAPVIFVGVGNGLTLPAANSGVMSVRPKLAGSASGMAGAMSVAGGGLLTWATGLLLTPENGAVMLLVLILTSVAISLLAAFYVRWVDMREPVQA
ncbi:multidrug effflux MFS transporter [Shimia abyssi]|uniref:Bcr/CflA family efflux transporter n=1 Tax=Shimia abyssi TaxID=1662395 RepID=A0A2P8FDG1_9RHOB|nr:multidrug effflux MFS transporter [Shimia abyssi]PSL19708.1 Bcr/CflA subfamily drug resistance transporter [Shimia abyssi]